jgi:hypothetical protein
MMRAAPQDVVCRNHEGVVLRYAPSALGRHHIERRPQTSDRDRVRLIAAEREILIMTIIFDHLELSGIARTRLDDAVTRIRRALAIKRRNLGMASAAVTEES